MAVNAVNNLNFNNTDQDEFNLDLSVFWDTLKKKGLKILILTTICFFILAIPILLLYKDKYTAEAYVFMDKTSTPSLSGVEMIFSEDRDYLKTNPFKSQLALLTSESLLEDIYNEMESSKSKLIDELNISEPMSLKGLLSAEQVKDTDFIKLKATTPNPEQSYELSQYYLDSYEDKANELYVKPISEKRKIIEEKILSTQNAVQAKSDQLRQFQESSNIVDPDQETGGGVQNLNNLQRTIDETESTIAEKKSQVAQIQKQLNLDTKSAISSAAVGEDELYSSISKDIQSLEKEYNSRSHQYTDQHPYMVLLKERIKVLKTQLIEEQRQILPSSTSSIKIRDSVRRELVGRLANIDTEYRALIDKQITNRKLYDSLQTSLIGMPTKQLTYYQLEGEIKTLQEILSQLNKNLATLRVQEATSRIYVYSKSKMPEKKDSPSLFQVLLMTFSGLFLFIYLFSCIRQLLKTSQINSIMDSINKSNIPVIEKHNTQVNSKAERHHYDALAFKLNHYKNTSGLNKFLVSHLEDSRKSPYCLQQLALSLSKLGHKILILDANYESAILRYDLGAALDLESSKPYSEIEEKLGTPASYKKYISDNSHIITGYESITFFDLFGIDKPGFEFFNTKSFQSIISNISTNDYDWILCNSPTLKQHSDLLALSSYFDGLIINTDFTDKGDNIIKGLHFASTLSCPITAMMMKQEAA